MLHELLDVPGDHIGVAYPADRLLRSKYISDSLT